jgi:anti-sigma factor RsiW
VPKRLEIERLVGRPRKWIYGAVAAALAAFICGGGAGWLARGVTATPTAIESLALDALDAHRLYVVEVRHPVEVPGSERAHLQTWLSKRCGWEVRARLLPGPTGPASFLMYESASGERYTLYTSRSKTGTAQMRYTAAENSGAMYWSEDDVGYVLTGPTDKERLNQVARLVYDQTEKGG